MTKPGTDERRHRQQPRLRRDDPARRRAAGAGRHAGPSARPGPEGQHAPADWRKSFYYHYYEYPGPHSVARHYGVVTDRYKLVHFYDPSDYWELFDLKSDPQELTSVYGKPEYAATTAELKAELTRLRAELKVPATDPPATMIPRPKAKGKK